MPEALYREVSLGLEFLFLSFDVADDASSSAAAKARTILKPLRIFSCLPPLLTR